MSRFLLIFAAVIMMSTPNAIAQQKMEVDMTKLTCAQLTKLGIQDFIGVTMWISGYYNATRHKTVVDLVEYARAATNVKAFCQKNPSATVMSSAEHVLGIKIPRR